MSGVLDLPMGAGVKVVTFGCRLNACESEAIAARASAEGLTDAVIFNTCAVTAEAVRQARQAIRRARRERPSSRLVVTGCAAQIEPQTFSAMDEVDLVLGGAEVSTANAFDMAGARVRVGDVFARRNAAGSAGAGPGRARAYVEIQNGCDHRCTFCVIPFGRGNSRSVETVRVIEEVRAMVARGFSEVVFTGVDLTSWGDDLPGTPRLGTLVKGVLDHAPDLARLRLSSLDAAEFDPALTECFATESRLMPHVHLSLQSGDDLILKRMKRRHRRADVLELTAAIRRVRPEIAFGADLIAGFPTESDAAFENTLSLVDEADIAFLHVFPYSPRPMTPAARMPQLPGAVIRERARRLRAAGEAARRRRLEAWLGRTASALVERPGLARCEDFTEVVFDGPARPGTLIRGTLSSHDGRRARLDRWAEW